MDTCREGITALLLLPDIEDLELTLCTERLSDSEIMRCWKKSYAGKKPMPLAREDTHQAHHGSSAT